MNIWFSLFIALVYINPNHAFYVSVTDLEYKAQEAALEMQVKIFTNDLEDEIRNYSNTIINLQDGITAAEGERVHAYINSKIELSIDGQMVPMEKKSCKLEGDAVFSKYTGKFKGNPVKLKVKNALLIDLFPTQTNIIRLKNSENHRILKLNKTEMKGELLF